MVLARSRRPAFSALAQSECRRIHRRRAQRSRPRPSIATLTRLGSARSRQRAADRAAPSGHCFAQSRTQMPSSMTLSGPVALGNAALCARLPSASAAGAGRLRFDAEISWGAGTPQTAGRNAADASRRRRNLFQTTRACCGCQADVSLLCCRSRPRCPLGAGPPRRAPRLPRDGVQTQRFQTWLVPAPRRLLSMRTAGARTRARRPIPFVLRARSPRSRACFVIQRSAPHEAAGPPSA